MTRSSYPRAIIFDLDGTLVDSAEDLRAALNRLLGELGLRAVETNEIKGMIGDGVLKMVERALVATGGDPQQSAALQPRFLELYLPNSANLTRCFPGVGETLDVLHRKDFRLAVVTNKPVAATNSILRALSLADFFQAVVGGDSVEQRKPHPAPLLEAARRLAVDVSETLMVGDNIHDVEAAHAAGMRCVSVSYGYHHRPPAEFGADRLIDRFADLLPLVINPASAGSSIGPEAERLSST